ncbi:hypothetical protein GGR57DRAFT_497706 [Xylariaceae sp. FL1272]|nr:hypothetical protein GGR57DRAFT_497706 [Xylariaceae sp. FL1272]
MVDYSMSKSAAHTFHEGLSAELKTRFNAPKIRTILVNQGYTKTPLFTGYKNDAGFLVPSLEPETVADAICKQVFTGRSGQVITPTFGRSLQLIQAMPHWWAYGLRSESKDLMSNWSGRQVVEDLDEFYMDKDKKIEKAGSDVEGSTVLVPQAK